MIDIADYYIAFRNEFLQEETSSALGTLDQSISEAGVFLLAYVHGVSPIPFNNFTTIVEAINWVTENRLT